MSTIDSSRTAPREAGRADTAVRVGVIVFAVGAVATVATLIPFLIGADALPRAVYLLSVLMPVGLAFLIGGVVATARGQRRSVPN